MCINLNIGYLIPSLKLGHLMLSKPNLRANDPCFTLIFVFLSLRLKKRHSFNKKK